MQGQAELRTLLDFLRRGDVLMVFDRLARSIGDLQDIARDVKARGATLKATEQPIDPNARALEAFLRKKIDGGFHNCVARVFGRTDHGFRG